MVIYRRQNHQVSHNPFQLAGLLNPQSTQISGCWQCFTMTRCLLITEKAQRGAAVVTPPGQRIAPVLSIKIPRFARFFLVIEKCRTLDANTSIDTGSQTIALRGHIANSGIV